MNVFTWDDWLLLACVAIMAYILYGPPGAYLNPNNVDWTWPANCAKARLPMDGFRLVCAEHMEKI